MTALRIYKECPQALRPTVPSGASMPLIDIAAGRRFLRALDPNADRFTFQTFDDSDPKRSQLARVFHGSLAEHARELAALNADGAGVFVAVQATDGRGRKTENVARVRACFQDDDGHGEPLPLAPHLVVRTSPGKFHRYLRVDGISRDDFDAVQARLIETYGSDPNCKDLARVLRVPGFYHCKGEPVLVNLLDTRDAPPYTRDEILAALPPVEQNSNTGKRERVDAARILAGVAEGQRDAALYQYACSLQARGAAREEANVLVGAAAAACNPPFDSREAAAKVNRAYRQFDAPDTGDDRPVIPVRAGHLPEAADAAERVLLATGAGVYQHAGGLVHVAAAQSDRFVRRAVGAVALHPVTPAYLVDVLTRAARFVKYDARSRRDVPIDCPAAVAATLLGRVGTWPFPALAGVVEAPLMLADGRVLHAPGFDTETGLLLALGDLSISLPAAPTHADAAAALEVLRRPLAGFPFADDVGEAVVLAAIITAIQRRILPSAPGFVFDAPVMGSGKTLLADVVGIIATGREVPKLPPGRNDAEDAKRLLSVLLAGDAVVCVDNIENEVRDTALCVALTSKVYADRILGESRVVNVPTNATFLLTGNNFVAVGDIATRLLVASLDPATERPEQRKFAGDLRQQVQAERAALVQAGLTILRAYHHAGRPDLALTPYGRFEQWSAAIRAPLVWAGAADPVASRERIAANDPKAAALGSLLRAWHDQYGNATTFTRQVLHDATPDAQGHFACQCGPVLREAMLTLAGDGDRVNPRKLGWQLRRIERRIIGGYRLMRGDGGNAVAWYVDRVAAVS